MGHSDRYDDAFREVARDTDDPQEIFERLAYQDVRDAADLLRPVFEETEGPGRLRLVRAAGLARLRRRGLDRGGAAPPRRDRPAQRADQGARHRAWGARSFEELTALGVNVNVTLLFAVERYREIAEAFLRGLERRLEAGEPIDRSASVASFFVSRVDTKVDAALEELGPRGPARPRRGRQRQARLCRVPGDLLGRALGAAGGGRRRTSSARSGDRRRPRTPTTRTRSTWTS